ncbi:PilZ domain-containing protein [Alcanivorax sp. DP30]|uniref:PilZ domain-containing protein n=1 Tax=Alcanivorax sp. DP30 TaxID=2606217 RepID=UPI0013685DA3|nr:PilZ domain-containing protein [Alcanivorax sp. DP30]MZR63478.1 PilZ domain-containing protein [Alcanivorax sp. DP30]
MSERRRVNRIEFDGEATLIFQQDSHHVELQDLSVLGARVHSETPLALPDSSPVSLNIILEDSDITLTLPGRVKRQEGQEIGIMFEKPSVDDMQHLRRLIMLNEGDEGDDNPASLLSPEH